jgi:hypothetical protein
MGCFEMYCIFCGGPFSANHLINDEGGDSDIRWLKPIVMLKNDTTDAPVFGHYDSYGNIVSNIGLKIKLDNEPITTPKFIPISNSKFYASHVSCWEICSKPTNMDFTDFNYQLKDYWSQVFEYQKLIDNHKLWMLTDPLSVTNDGILNRERILQFYRSHKNSTDPYHVYLNYTREIRDDLELMISNYNHWCQKYDEQIPVSNLLWARVPDSEKPQELKKLVQELHPKLKQLNFLMTQINPLIADYRKIVQNLMLNSKP